MKKKFIFRFFLTIFLINLFYLILVIIDISLPRLAKFNKKYFEAQEIISSLSNKQYYFSPTLLFENNKFKNLAFKKNIILPGSLLSQSNLNCDEGYGLIKINNDRFGFRNKDIYWDEISKIDLILIGDSFGFGVCVNEEENISGVLTKQGIRTLNLSIPGNSPANYLFLTKLFVKAVNPNYVLILFYVNDNHTLDIYSPYYALSKKLKPNNYFTKNNDKLVPTKKLIEFDKIIKKKKYERANFFDNFEKYLKLTNLRTFIQNFFFKHKLITGSKDTIDSIIKICKVSKCKPMFGLIKNSEFWDPNFYYDNYKASLNRYLSNYGYKLITFEETINTDDKRFFSPKGGHLSKEGYSYVANKIIKNLK